MASQTDEFGGVAVTPQTTTPQTDEFGGVPASASQQAPAPDHDEFGGVPADRVKSLTQDEKFDPASHAAQNPQDAETAYQVYQARKNQGWGDWFKGVGRTLNNPTTYLKAGQGVVNFLGGLGQSIIADPIAHAYYSATGDPRALTKQAEATLEAQHGEESAKGLVNAAIAARPGTYSGGWGESTGDIESELSPEAKDAHERALFAQRVQQAKNALQLEQGRPLDTGAIAGIYHAAGQQPSEEVGPESLTASGAPAVDPGNIERASAASDPTMLALAAAPGLPGVSYLGGRIAQGVGKVAQLPMDALESAGRGITHLGPAGRTAAAVAGSVGAVEAVPSIIHHPIIAAAAAGAKGLQILGRAAEQQGKELATGVPSELTTNAANAAATGESAIWNNTQRRLGNAAAQGASTAVGMVPLNAALSEGDPNKFAESEVGAGAFGGTLGSFARNRPMMVEAVRPFLRSEGVRALTEASQGNDPLAAKSQAYLMSIPEEARNRALEAIGAIQGLPTDTPNGQVRAKVYVLNDADYRNVIADKFGMQQAAMGGGRGFYIGDDGAAYVNGDYHSGLDPSELGHTVGHEFGGHAAVNIMQAMGAKGGQLYTGLIGAARDALMPGGRPTADFYRFVKNYNRAFDPSGKTQRLDFQNPESIEEFLAEQAGQLMAAKGAGELAIPQTIQDKISDGLGRYLGKVVGVDTDKVGTPTHFGREEVGKLSKLVQDTLGQVVGMKLRGGAEIPEPAKTDTTRISELQATLNTPRPKPGSPLEEVRQWISDQKAARSELSSLQQGQTGAFPASGQPPTPPSAPQAPNVPAPAPTPSRASVAAALRLNGIPSAEAQQWAQQAQGSTVEEMVLDALKRRAGQKFPSQPPAAKTPPNQAAIIPPAESTPNEQPAPTPNENGALPPSRVETEERAGQGVAPAQPVEVQTPEHLDAIAAKAREEFLADKEPAKSGKNKGQHTAANQKAADKAAFDATAEAHAETVPENYQGLRQRTDAFGQKSVSGKVDPSRPFDVWLIKQAMDSGHLTPDSLKTLLNFQDSIGKTVSYDYGHAPVADEGDMPTKEGRAAAQAESSVADRLAGGPMQTERKTSVPLRVGYNSGTKSFTVYGVSQEKLLNNFNHLSEKMDDLGIQKPFRDINDPRFVAAFKAIIRNQEHGYTGDGKSPSVSTEEFPNTPDPDWKNSPEHQIVPDDQFQFINAILADEGAKPPKRGDATVSKAKAHLANENQRLLNAEGETNPLRQKINDAEPGWTKATLEDPLNENISPALASNLGEGSQSDESIRQHGKIGDISRFFDQGRTPNRAKTSAGFLPDTAKTAKERAQERIAARTGSANPAFMPDSTPSKEEPAPEGQGPSGSPQDRPSVGGTSPKDTGKPEEGEIVTKPAIRDSEGNVRTGQIHALIEGAGETGTTDGFVTNKGRFVTREEADRMDRKAIPMSVRGDIDASEIQDPIRRVSYLEQEIERASPDEAEALREELDSTNREISNLGYKRDGDVYRKTGANFMPDTGKPEEGETPGERLMREAEAAGLAPSLETTKGILRGDAAAMDKLRKMIADKTGAPARFMPYTAGAENSSDAVKNRAAELWKTKGTESPFFQKWFSGSKTVDPDGSPIILKHGSRSRFNEFDQAKNQEPAFSNGKKPLFFSESESTAKSYGPEVGNYFVKLNNPLKLREIVGRDEDGEYQREAFMMEDDYNALPDSQKELLEAAKDGDADTDDLVKSMMAKGSAAASYSRAFRKWGTAQHDGIIAYDTLDRLGEGDRDNIYIAFDPEQIKSTENDGAFDRLHMAH